MIEKGGACRQDKNNTYMQELEPAKSAGGGLMRKRGCNCGILWYIIELVDSISRDGPDTPIYVIHHKRPKTSAHTQFHII